MNKFEFIVSDETLNSYGLIVKTAGINTDRFERNPIMLYMHDRDQGIIGRWENVRKENGKLMAEAVFDEGVELGAKIKHQVESGFIRSASIGIENMRYEDFDGVKTIVECDLYEISIVDIPANENAVKLFAKGRRLLNYPVHLKKDKLDDTKELRSHIIELLGLTDKATDDDIITSVKGLLEKRPSTEKEVDEAIACGLIHESDRMSFCAMAKADIAAFRLYCKGCKEKQQTDIEKLLRSYPSIRPCEAGYFTQVGRRLGVDVLRGILSVYPGNIRISEMIRLGRIDKKDWTLDQYRKYDPITLRDDPELYKRLIERETGEKYANKDLDYYRRYEPETLAENPELYERLIKQQKQH